MAGQLRFLRKEGMEKGGREGRKGEGKTEGGEEGERVTLVPRTQEAQTYFFTLASPLGILRNFFFFRILTALLHSVSESSTSLTLP